MPIVFKQVTPEAHQEFTAVKDITMTCCDESTVTEMYEAFEQFMRACGYTVPAEDNNMIADFGNDPYNQNVDVVFQRELKET